jgi:hypothetical protein
MTRVEFTMRIGARFPEFAVLIERKRAVHELIKMASC